VATKIRLRRMGANKVPFYRIVVVDSRCSPKGKFIEIAGGGRYDKLVGNFVHNYNYQTVPSTGFAFGIERVVNMLDELEQFSSSQVLNSHFSFYDSNAETLLVIKCKTDIVSSYFKAVKIIEQNQNKRFDIYVGDTNEYKAYQKQKNIKESKAV